MKIEIFVSMDYKSFKFLVNRVISNKRVEELKIALLKKDLGRSYPIVVNMNKEIIDGQHRFVARKELGLPIYYVMGNDMDVLDAAESNRVTKSWSERDFLEVFAKSKNENYEWVIDKSKEWNVSTDVVLRLLGKKGGRSFKIIRSGGLVLTAQHKANASNIFKNIKLFEDVFPKGWKQACFIIAVRAMIKCKNYDPQVMKKKFEYLSGSFKKQADTKSYIEMLEEIYNYRNSNLKIHIHLDNEI